MTFETALDAYKAAGEAALVAEEEYRRGHATEVLNCGSGPDRAPGTAAPNAEARKAQVDLKTSELRLTRDRLALAKEAAFQIVLYLREGGRTSRESLEHRSD